MLVPDHCLYLSIISFIWIFQGYLFIFVHFQGTLLVFFWDCLGSTILISSLLCFWNLWLTTGVEVLTFFDYPVNLYLSCSSLEIHFI